jgi:hypothetical protein
MKKTNLAATMPKTKVSGNADTHNIYLVPLTCLIRLFIVSYEDPLSALKTLFVSAGGAGSDAQGRRTGF